LRRSPDPCDILKSRTRALARGTYICSYLRKEGRLSENPHIVLRFADALLSSLRSLKITARPS
jgi:hypothetical protein